MDTRGLDGEAAQQRVTIAQRIGPSVSRRAVGWQAQPAVGVEEVQQRHHPLAAVARLELAAVAGQMGWSVWMRAQPEQEFGRAGGLDRDLAVQPGAAQVDRAVDLHMRPGLA